MDNTTQGARIRSARKRAGMTQYELAAATGLSLSWVKKIERDVTGTHPRLETLHRIATALRVKTSTLVIGGDPEVPDMATTEEWTSVRRALVGLAGTPSEQPTPEGIVAILHSCRPALAANRFTEVRRLLPALIRDVQAVDSRSVQSRVYNLTGWLLTMTRQWDAAEIAVGLAADAADNRLDEAASINTAVWALLRQGKLAEASTLASSYASQFEPRMSEATVRELALWGRLQLSVTNAAIRDNRPGDARNALSLAETAACRIGQEVTSDRSTTRTFGPVTVAMIKAENAALERQPQKVLTIAKTVPVNILHPLSASRLRHRLDVASAQVMLKQHTEATHTMADIHAQAPEWLRQQRYARDIVQSMIAKRRSLTPEMRELATAVRLPMLRSVPFPAQLPARDIANSTDSLLPCCNKRVRDAGGVRPMENGNASTAEKGRSKELVLCLHCTLRHDGTVRDPVGGLCNEDGCECWCQS